MADPFNAEREAESVVRVEFEPGTCLCSERDCGKGDACPQRGPDIGTMHIGEFSAENLAEGTEEDAKRVRVVIAAALTAAHAAGLDAAAEECDEEADGSYNDLASALESTAARIRERAKKTRGKP